MNITAFEPDLVDLHGFDLAHVINDFDLVRAATGWA
jgi:hypothetical protein